MLEVLAGIGQHHGARPQIAAPYAYRIRGAKCAGQQTKGMAPLPPLAGVDITVGPPPDLPYLWRVDPQHLEPPARQSLNEGDPRDPVDSRATGVIRHRANQSAMAAQSTVYAPKQRTGCGSSRGGTAPSCASAPTSMPAACRLTAASWGGRADCERPNVGCR
jgi:hypothetical protein